MAAWLALPMTLGVGLALCASSAMAAGQNTGNSPATGTMYNGNNVQPPASFIQDTRQSSEQLDPTGSPSGNKDDGSATTQTKSGG
jgi:hypothetical protein